MQEFIGKLVSVAISGMQIQLPPVKLLSYDDEFVILQAAFEPGVVPPPNEEIAKFFIPRDKLAMITNAQVRQQIPVNAGSPIPPGKGLLLPGNGRR